MLPAPRTRELMKDQRRARSKQTRHRSPASSLRGKTRLVAPSQEERPASAPWLEGAWREASCAAVVQVIDEPQARSWRRGDRRVALEDVGGPERKGGVVTDEVVDGGAFQVVAARGRWREGGVECQPASSRRAEVLRVKSENVGAVGWKLTSLPQAITVVAAAKARAVNPRRTGVR